MSLDLPEGAEAYRRGIERVYSWFDDTPEMSQYEFDSLSAAYDELPEGRVTGRTWIAPFYGDRNIWFVQILVREGYLTAHKEGGRIVYRKSKT